MNKEKLTIQTDILLIGAGIMSATLAALIKKIYPNLNIIIVERLSSVGLESSGAFNNAGTGHAGYCELQYSPIDASGNVDITKTLKVNKWFQKSVEFWRYLMLKGDIKTDFIHNVPHLSFVEGDDVPFLKKRYDALKQQGGSFRRLLFSDNFEEIKQWIPLMMEGRDKTKPIAVTRADNGLDVDFGKLSEYLIDFVQNNGGKIFFNTTTTDIKKVGDKWVVSQQPNSGDANKDDAYDIEAKFVFIGAGGAAINLLKKANIKEAAHYAGFPVDGQWLVCKNPDVVNRHYAKVYSNPESDAPQMVAPHLDTRIINGEKCLLFGPYAGATTKFLKSGSIWDFFKSIRLDNITTMVGAGIRNIPMIKYLISEVFKGKKKKFKVLKHYYPEAKIEDWELVYAAKRVQTMKVINGKGVIEFGTEMVSSEDKTLSCLLGASPGASTAVNIMLDLIKSKFTPDEIAKNKIKEMIPSYDNI